MLLCRFAACEAPAGPPCLWGAMMIEITNVSKFYGPFQVLKNCSAQVARGEVVVICGPSGSGKSTLIKTLNGLEKIDAGEITIGGFRLAPGVTNVKALRSSVGLVFQHF